MNDSVSECFGGVSVYKFSPSYAIIRLHLEECSKFGGDFILFLYNNGKFHFNSTGTFSVLSAIANVPQ